MRRTPRKGWSYVLSLLLGGALLSGCEPQPSLYGFIQSDVNKGKGHMIREVHAPMRTYPMKFDEWNSDPDALRALRALKPSVLVPNARGDREGLILEGLYEVEGGYFKLKHWYLVTPFLAQTFTGDRARVVSRRDLVADDFYGTIDFDPSDYTVNREAHRVRMYGGKHEYYDHDPDDTLWEYMTE